MYWYLMVHAFGLTRTQVASRLGCSVSWIRKLEAAGRLHPVRGVDGRWWHDEIEVAAMVQVQSCTRTQAVDQAPGAGLHRAGPYRDATRAPPALSRAPSMVAVATWREHHIGHLIDDLRAELVSLGWDGAFVQAGLAAARAALSVLPDEHAVGALWPPWVARAAMAWSLFGQELERPWVETWSTDGLGAWVPTTRPVQPGD